MNRIIRENDNAKKAAGRKASDAATHAAKAAAKAAKAAAAPGSANESRKTILRLTESDLHRIVKKSVNRILREGYSKKKVLNINESKNSHRAKKQALAIASQLLDWDEIRANHVVEMFMEKFLNGCNDWFIKFLPKLVEIYLKAWKSGPLDSAGLKEAIELLLSLSREEVARGIISRIRTANTVEDLEDIAREARWAVMRERSKRETIDPWTRIGINGRHNYVNDNGELKNDTWY